MKKFLKVSALAMVLATTGNVAVVTNAEAASQAEIEKRKKRKTQVLSERSGKKVQKAFEFYSADQIDEAIAILVEIKPGKEFDKAYIARFIANMYAQQSKSKLAIKYLKDAIDIDLLNFNEHSQSMKLLSDLYLQEKQYKNAIKGYEAWMEFTGEEESGVYLRISNAYYELKQYDKVIAPADKSIELAEKPNAGPYSLKMASYYARKQYKQAVKVLEVLVKLFPADKKWWPQLGQFYMLTEDYVKALSVMELAYKQGFLEKPSQYKVLAQLYATNEIPYKSAVIQEKFLKKGDKGLIERNKQAVSTLANTWHAAKHLDKAARYYGEAAAFDNDPDLFRKQGTLLNQSWKYAAAVPALKKALEFGIKRPGRVHMELASSYFYQEKYKLAYSAIKEAMKDKTTAKSARAWSRYIKDTAERKGVKI